MSGTVNTIGSSSGASYTQSLSSGAVASGSVTAQDTSTQSSGTQSLFSARIIIDPVAGVITEYLDQKGDVQDQSPSSSVVAYLRAGLTAQGFSKPAAAVATTASTTGSTAPTTSTPSTSSTTSTGVGSTTNAVV